MRKAYVAVMVVILLGFAGMMFAAQGLVGSMSRDAELSRSLTNALQARSVLAQGTKVLAVRAVPSKNRLATEGRGVVVELTPADDQLRREGGLDTLARVVARVTIEEIGADRTRWIEVKMRVGPEGKAEPLRTLVPIEPTGEVGMPEPSLSAMISPPHPGRPPAPAPAPAAPAAPGAKTPEAPAAPAPSAPDAPAAPEAPAAGPR